MDSPAVGDPCLRAQQRRKGQGVPGVRHRAQRECRRSVGGGSAVLAEGGAGFARNSQCTPGHGGSPPQGSPDPAGASGARQSFRRIPSAGLEILTSLAERSWQIPSPRRETWFYGVKIFSYCFVLIS